MRRICAKLSPLPDCRPRARSATRCAPVGKRSTLHPNKEVRCGKGVFMLRHNKGLFGLSILFVMVCLIFSSGVTGQSGTTSVHGIVTDQNGASVPNATLTLTSPAIGVTLTAQTDKDGGYQFL